MNPQQDQTPGLRLPQPSFNAGQAPQMPPVAYQQPVPQQPPQIMPGGAAMNPQPAAMPATPQQPINGLPQANMPAMQEMPTVQADDESAIDQEWTTKAREIVERTHADPFLESRELSKIKAQYIKVRYNKDIKVED
jgi:hypothetical protein